MHKIDPYCIRVILLVKYLRANPLLVTVTSEVLAEYALTDMH